MTAKEILDFLQSLQSSGQDLSQVEIEFHYSFGCEGTTVNNTIRSLREKKVSLELS